MPMTLKNKTRRTITLVLDHQHYCEAEGRCACVEIRGQHVPSSLTVPALTEAQDVSGALIKLPKLRALIRAGFVELGDEPHTEPVDDQKRARRGSRGKAMS